MWFKNLQIYRLVNNFKIETDALQNALYEQRIRDCSQLERHTFGWAPPLGVGYESLVHTANGCQLIAAAKREKILPSSVIRERADAAVIEQERQEGRQLSKRERRTVIDEVTLQLLPLALSRTSLTYAYLDSQAGLLLVDTSSQKRADELIILLRDCVGQLPVVLPQLSTSIGYTMTQWLLQDRAPAGFTIDDFCELQQPDKERSIIRCQHRDVTTESIRTHLAEGMQVVQLGMTWNDRISFVLDHNFIVKRIKFLELDQYQDDDSGIASFEEQFDADFSIFSAEFAKLVPDIADALGGFSDILALEAETLVNH